MLTGHTWQYICIHIYAGVCTHICILIVYNKIKINQKLNINKVLSTKKLYKNVFYNLKIYINKDIKFLLISNHTYNI